jgi:hypothetical protein
MFTSPGDLVWGVRRRRSYPIRCSHEDVKATYSDGILEVVVPGAAKHSTQRVPVEVGSEKKSRSEDLGPK